MAKKNSKQPKPDKVAIRREKEIKEAIECGNWKRVVHLLSLPLENAERRDRYHGKLSINFTYKKKEMLDFLPDNSRHSNPLESLIYEEDREVHLSDKTVKRRLEKSLKLLREKLEE